MTTLGELHRKAGNPDLDHWKPRKVYTIEDAALLTVGIDPLFFGSVHGDELVSILKESSPVSIGLPSNSVVNWKWFVTVLKGLCESICTGEIKCQNVIILKENETYNGYESWESTVEQVDLGILDANNIITWKTILTKKEHFKWLQINNFIFEKPSHGLLANGTFVANNPVKTINVEQSKPLLLSAPKYTTPAIDCMNEVIFQFWLDYDPDGCSPPPKATVIIAWLGEHGHKWGVTSQNQIMAIDLIARHPTARTRTKK